MQKKVFIVFAALLAIVGIGIGIGWLASRDSSTPPPAVSPDVPEISQRPPDQSPPTLPSPTPTQAPPAPRPPGPSGPVVGVAPPGTSPTIITNWEDRLDDILGAEDDDTNKVVQMLAMFRNLPLEGQEEVAQHLSNLVEDENYAPLGKLLEDATLPESVLDILVSDLLNRPNADKLPMLLVIARNSSHPGNEEAKDLLELYLEEDYGADWNLWQQKIQVWLKENPDE